MRLAHRLYGLLLFLYPRSFRIEHGREMGQTFRSLLGEARVRGGVRGITWFCLQTLGDVVTTAIVLRSRATLTNPRRDRGDLLMSILVQETLQSLRRLVRRPIYTAGIVAMLGLAIGANTAIFSLVHAAFLRPLPYHDPGQLVTVRLAPEKPFTKAEFVAFREALRDVEGLAAIWSDSVTWTGTGKPEILEGGRITAGYFPLLGVEPTLGRGFATAETEPGDNLVILSHALWQGRFAGDPDVLGKAMNLDGAPHEIIGVMPEGFFSLPSSARFWRPMQLDPKRGEWHAVSRLNALGRLREGATLAAAAEAVRELARQRREVLPRYYDPDFGDDAAVARLPATVMTSYRRPLLILQATVAFVLLIACANVAHLLLARTSERSGELGVRRALGASSVQLFRQFLIESLLFCLAGGGAGYFLAHVALRALARPADLPAWARIEIDQNVLMLTSGIALLCALLFGLLPFLQGTGTNLRQRFEDADLARGGRTRHHHVVLVTTEVAMAVVLLLGAGLMSRSLWQLRGVEPGFETERFLTVRLDPPETEAGYADPVRRVALYDQIREQVGAVPGVEAVTFGQQVPLVDEVWGTEIRIERSDEERAGHPVRFMTVGRGYFSSLSIPLVRGRVFRSEDRADTAPVVIVNERLARQMWGHEDPIGARVRLVGAWRTVVGVIGDIKQVGLDVPAPPTIFRPLEQSPQIVSMRLFVRMSTDSASALGAVRSAIWAVEPHLPISQTRTLEQVVEQSIVMPRMLAQMLGAFAAIAVVLSVGGIFGVVSLLVNQRRRELGIRMALGARRIQVLRSVMARGLLPVALGLCLGVVGALALGRTIESLLFEVAPWDPRTVVAVVASLALVSLLACFLPAYRATQRDITAVLRLE